MTAPQIAAERFGWACLLGAALGFLYGFLRPARQKRTTLGDLLFLAAAVWAWLFLSFGICQGDLRLAYTAGLFLGGIGWEATAGRYLRPVFRIFWKGIGNLLGFFFLPVKKISKFIKKLLASAGKWVTIKWSNRRLRRRRSGGVPNGRNQELFQSNQAGLPAQQQSDQADRIGGHRVIYGSTDHPASVHGGYPE